MIYKNIKYMFLLFKYLGKCVGIHFFVNHRAIFHHCVQAQMKDVGLFLTSEIEEGKNDNKAFNLPSASG